MTGRSFATCRSPTLRSPAISWPETTPAPRPARLSGTNRPDDTPTGNPPTDKHALCISTVALSLHYQSPAAWPVLASRGMDITFAAARDEFAAGMSALGQMENIRVGRSVSPRSLLTGALDLRRLLARDWDLVQVQTPVVGALARLVPRRAPLVYVAHGFHFHQDGGRLGNALYSSVERALAGRADAIAVVSGEDFTAAKELGFHRRTRLWRLPGAGVDLERFPLAPRPQHDGVRLLYIGELNPNKDPLQVLRVLADLRRSGLAVSATVVGDGPLRTEVAASVQRLNGAHPGCVEWIPHTTHPDRYVRAADVLLLPSAREGLPRVVIEALAAGRPVVARSNRGTRELLSTAEHGRLMPPASTVSDWAAAVMAVAQAPDAGPRLRQSMVQYGTHAFSSSYSLLVDTVLSGSHTRGAFDLGDQAAMAASSDQAGSVA